MTVLTPIDAREVPPALLDPEWIPPVTGWDELCELRDQHQLLVARVREAANALRELQRRREAEDEAYRAALRGEARGGSSPVPERRLPEREAELSNARERARAAHEALVEQVNEAVAVIVDRAPDWLADLDGIEAAAERSIAKARAALREAESQRGMMRRLRHWVDRTSGPATELPFLHLQYGAIPVATPGAEGGAG